MASCGQLRKTAKKKGSGKAAARSRIKAINQARSQGCGWVKGKKRRKARKGRKRSKRR